ncbi:MAG: hypothetical protein LBV18_04495 [Alistipes sp.]|jgi:opacity protein-like surface antigen|nr:hypothetical protein [Alistipes sp.]
MKRMLVSFFATALAIVAAVSANAQKFDKGDWFVGARGSGLDLSFSERLTDSLSVTDFDIAAGGGYFISNKFAVEAELGFDYGKTEDSDGVSSFVFGAGVRYYPVDNLFARIAYRGVAASNDSGLASTLEAALGYDLFVSEKVFFEPMAYYRRNLAGYGVNTFGLSLGVGVRF